MSKPGVMIAAGGTGGHLFPAFALTQELMRRGYEVELVTDVRADQYGIEFPGRAVHHVPSATLRGRSPLAVVELLRTLTQGVFSARALIAQTAPGVVVGFGGYPTVPPLVAARMAGVPSVIHEANAVMGRANRLLSRIAAITALTFAETGRMSRGARKRARVVGMPVRDAVLAAAGKPFNPPRDNDALSLLIFGGSQGARVFADVVPGALSKLPKKLKSRLKLVQQVREEDMERVRKVYGKAGIEADLATFFRDLPARMADAHIIIARSGAGTVAELSILGRPSILVPLPHALDNDQLENATRLQDAGGAWCLEQADFTPERLRNEIVRLAGEPDALTAAALAAREMGEPYAVSNLADVVEELAGREQGVKEELPE